MHVVFLTDDSTILQSMWKCFIHGATFFIPLGREEFKNNSLRGCVCVYLSSPTVCNFFIHYFNPNLLELPRQTFSLQYQYIIKQTSDEN